jgi:phage protein D
MEAVRKPEVSIVYEGRDISRDIAMYLKDFSFTDNAHGKADSIEIGLEDIKGLWHGDWLPVKGDKIKAGINFKGKSLSCGVFSIDEIDYSTPPDTVQLKGISAFTAKSFRREKKNRIWENITFKGVCQELAVKAGYSLFFEAETENISFSRCKQFEQSDLKFLKDMAEGLGCNIKVADEKLIVFSGAKYDSRPPAFVIEKGTSDIISCSFRTQAHEVYSSCEVVYWEEAEKKEKKYVFKDPDVSSGQVLKINKRVDNIAEAELRAKSELRKKNSFEVTGNISMSGGVEIYAGLVCEIKGFGAFDGNYFIEDVNHRISSGYTADLNIRRVKCY